MKITKTQKEIKIIKAAECSACDWLGAARKVLGAGGIVAFPTETVYGLAADALNDSAIERLNHLKRRAADKPYTVHIAKPADMKRFVPNPFWFAQVLARKAWPGPITFVIELDESNLRECKSRFGENFDKIYYNASIGLRCPSHPIATSLLDTCDMIIVAPSANPAGESPACSVDEITDYFGNEIDLILDGGTVKYAKPSTVVKITRDSYEILREGVIDKRTIDKLTRFNIMFVCTGNTCRSPMAEGWGKKLIAEYIGCDISELDKFKVHISSAGTFAALGSPASEFSVRAMSSYGIDISSHYSQPLDLKKMREADVIYVMSEGHKDFINTLAPELSDKIKLIRKGGVPDPIGTNQAEYNRICEIIKESTEQQIKELFQ